MALHKKSSASQRPLDTSLRPLVDPIFAACG